MSEERALPRFYDIAIDEFREVTQDDVDHWMAIFSKMGLMNQPDVERAPVDFSAIRLAVYPNKFREGEAFVAGAKPLEPYPGVSGLRGEPLYPSVPLGTLRLGSSMPINLAREVARVWNEAREAALEPA